MKTEFFSSIRFKMLLIFIKSGGAAGCVTFIIVSILRRIYRLTAIEGSAFHLLRRAAMLIGETNIIAVLFLPLFFLFYLLLSRRYAKRLDAISDGISRIASGDFDVTIPVYSSDEIGAVAKNVNLAAKELKAALESGEFAKSSKDRLIIDLAHDLRTPLTSVSGYLNLIINQKQMPDEKVRHYAQIAYNKSLKLQRLIDSLFLFTKFNYGEVERRRDRVDFSFMLKQIFDEFLPVFMENSLKGRISIPEKPVMVEVDGDMIARALDNIIGNAVRFGNGGLYIDLELSCITAANGTEYAVTRIINYDSYIPPDEAESIFETFYRLDKSRTEGGDKYVGSGLGLAIAKSIITAHDGTITAASDMSQTTFEIRLPIRYAP